MLYYRGQSKKFPVNPMTKSDLTPSLFRNRNLNTISLINEAAYYNNLFENLQDILNIKKTPDYVALGKLQHYSVPTRLLDITADKDVAYFFACNNHFDEDGYVYLIDDRINFHDPKSDTGKSITRKIATLFLAGFLINNKIDLNEYFRKKEEVKYIHASSISKAVILDYAHVFGEQNSENIRYARQKGSFILFGNKVDERDSSMYLRDEVNFEGLKDLKAEKVPAADKLSMLENLAIRKGKHFVYFFPDDDRSLRLIAKYHEIFHLESKQDGLKTLNDFINERFPIEAGESSVYADFKNVIIENITEIYDSSRRNPDCFYFIFQEMQSFFLYSRKQFKDLEKAFKIVREIFKAA